MAVSLGLGWKCEKTLKGFCGKNFDRQNSGWYEKKRRKSRKKRKRNRRGFLAGAGAESIRRFFLGARRFGAALAFCLLACRHRMSPCGFNCHLQLHQCRENDQGPLCEDEQMHLNQENVLWVWVFPFSGSCCTVSFRFWGSALLFTCGSAVCYEARHVLECLTFGYYGRWVHIFLLSLQCTKPLVSFLVSKIHSRFIA